MLSASTSDARAAVSYNIRHSVFSRSGTSRRDNAGRVRPGRPPGSRPSARAAARPPPAAPAHGSGSGRTSAARRPPRPGSGSRSPAPRSPTPRSWRRRARPRRLPPTAAAARPPHLPGRAHRRRRGGCSGWRTWPRTRRRRRPCARSARSWRHPPAFVVQARHAPMYRITRRLHASPAAGLPRRRGSLDVITAHYHVVARRCAVIGGVRLRGRSRVPHRRRSPTARPQSIVGPGGADTSEKPTDKEHEKRH